MTILSMGQAKMQALLNWHSRKNMRKFNFILKRKEIFFLSMNEGFVLIF
jgi:hypothetical protein